MLGVAIGVDLALVAALGEVAAELDHLLVGGDGFGGLVLLVIDGGEALEEDAAVGFLFLGVGAVGVLGEVDHLLVDGDGFVVAAEDIEQQAFVVSGFEGLGIFGDGLCGW